MPKTNDQGGATYAGYEGVVEHAGGPASTRPGGLSELDPSRNLDGSVVDGFDSEEREMDGRDGPATVIGEVRPADQPQDSQPLDEREEDRPSVGTNSSESPKSSESSSAKNARGRR